ncbi:TetR/AcrR family transcriptional regulator [Microbacterium fluvii]|uniref:TetR/AcrR family transcriptional regulator n=1 Tax=Microbacterium fluvii TaxID=415215 RepID=A0ABW2HJR5_9MICO|nr:TetR/AcrR family transcriptional regulator [Microbacterium fluvii]MCU4673401.1 TetR/AcrR family transcriptional regulator [Microbacterium fluvii]
MTDITVAPSRRRETTRAKLFEAAAQVFAEVGMDAASVEMICDRAGFTRGAFYSNFESKDQLFLELITHMTEAKLDEVAVRVRAIEPGEIADPAALVHQIIGVSEGAGMEPQLVSELRTQALRDPRMAEAYLAWHDGIIGRVEQIIDEVTALHPVRLRLTAPQAARLLVDIADDTCVRAAIEGCSRAQTEELLKERLQQIVVALVDIG